jgi:hypothetical protein
MALGETFLKDQGFTHVENDEPHEDHWLLEGMPNGLSLLVEREHSGWSVSHEPRGDDPRGEWSEMDGDLDDEGMILLVTSEIHRTGHDVGLRAGNRRARIAGEAHGLAVNPRIADADLR